MWNICMRTRVAPQVLSDFHGMETKNVHVYIHIGVHILSAFTLGKYRQHKCKQSVVTCRFRWNILVACVRISSLPPVTRFQKVLEVCFLIAFPPLWPHPFPNFESVAWKCLRATGQNRDHRGREFPLLGLARCLPLTALHMLDGRSLLAASSWVLSNLWVVCSVPNRVGAEMSQTQITQNDNVLLGTNARFSKPALYNPPNEPPTTTTTITNQPTNQPTN